MKSIYLIGSMRNPLVVEVAAALRDIGFDVFDDWHAAGPTAEDEWRKYENQRGRSYVEALDGYAACHTYEYNMRHLKRCDMGVLVMPSGRLAHLEFGYMIGLGKKCYVLFDQPPEGYGLMYKMASGGFFSFTDLARCIFPSASNRLSAMAGVKDVENLTDSLG